MRDKHCRNDCYNTDSGNSCHYEHCRIAGLRKYRLFAWLAGLVRLSGLLRIARLFRLLRIGKHVVTISIDRGF